MGRLYLPVGVRPKVDLHRGEVSEAVLGKIGRAKEYINYMG